jgi:hypothetical protein
MVRQIGHPDVRHDPAWLAGLVDAMEAVSGDHCEPAADLTLRDCLVAHLNGAKSNAAVPADDDTEAQAASFELSCH